MALFKPGKSGNPNGRPKDVELRRLARERTVDAITTLIQVMRSPRSAAAARVMAANSLLDRGWGRAVQPQAFTDIDGNDRPLGEIEFTDLEKARRIAHILAQGLKVLPAQQPQLNSTNPQSDLHRDGDSQVDSITYPEESA